MTIPRHCEEYTRLLDRQILLALAQMCGARIANPRDPEEEKRRHKSTCLECRALAQARCDTAPPAGEQKEA